MYHSSTNKNSFRCSWSVACCLSYHPCWTLKQSWRYNVPPTGDRTVGLSIGTETNPLDLVVNLLIHCVGQEELAYSLLTLLLGALSFHSASWISCSFCVRQQRLRIKSSFISSFFVINFKCTFYQDWDVMVLCFLQRCDSWDQLLYQLHCSTQITLLNTVLCLKFILKHICNNPLSYVSALADNKIGSQGWEREREWWVFYNDTTFYFTVAMIH